MQLYQLLRHGLFRLDPERAHWFANAALDAVAAVPGIPSLLRRRIGADPVLRSAICGLTFDHPLGLAAGFDKDGRHVRGMAALGFAYLELGTVTPLAQPGNERPRLFRLSADDALINRMGFNNQGAEELALRLRRMRRPVPLGVNIGKNKITPNEEATADYLRCFRLLAPLADYVVVNISSPNTPGLRELSRREPLEALLNAIQAERRRLDNPPPLFVKLSPDEDSAGLDAALGAALAAGADGLIATNTTLARPGLRSSGAGEAGGLSGAPLRERADAVMAYLRRATGGALPLIGVGGISDGASAYERIRAGASLLQLYTALIYRGPAIVPDTLRELGRLLRRDGFSSVAEAVGSGAERGAMS
ncbi:MAG TPA: quinone-dependent dihydroorotate dehydrogenase [Herpetosiphonaceae bacterium]